ncbi:sporulation inhibitor of replication protein SirA, partial [Butyricicoccus sp. 1XD8-22]
YIEAVCEGSRMLDLDLFQSLGQINDSFLAFNKEEAECGWLKPIKHLTY